MPENTATSISNAEKAAILLSTLPEDRAVDVFKHLKEHEIEKLIKVMISLEPPKKETVKSVLEEAFDILKEASPIKLAPDKLRKILESSLPPEKLQKLLEETFITEEGKAIFRELEKMDPKVVASILQNEHPQVRCSKLLQIHLRRNS